VSIGDTLAEARRQAGLTITQVSQQTRIRESIIRAIEQGDFSPCGGDFYARGHIRSIASVVGVDPAPLIREDDEEHGPPGRMRAAEIFEPATPIRIREPRPFGLGKILVVLLLAVIGFGTYRLVSTRSTHSTAPPAATVRPTVSAKPHATASAVAHHPSGHPSGPVEAVIKVTAIQKCWVGLTSSSGQQLYQGIVSAGNTMTWRERHPVSVVIGNPGGIVLTVNGKAEHMSTTQVVTLSINPSSKTPVDTTSPVTAVSAPSPSATP
jgi:cytoskeletal protein RodZ